MRVLALDTSTEYCSVALWQDGAVIERCELAGQKHSEMLIGMLDALLEQSGLKLAQLDGIAFGKGPGSFTGVRIACGATQGLGVWRRPPGGRDMHAGSAGGSLGQNARDRRTGCAHGRDLSRGV